MTVRSLAIAGGQTLALIASCHCAQAADAPPTTPKEPVQSIVVSSKRLPVENLVDRKVYDITTDVLANFGSVSDVLTAIPSVDVDGDGVVSLRGDNNVLILIDGKPSTLFSGSKAGDNLQSIPAKDIERIEVLTTPPPQFKAEGASGVINIITRKKRPEGFSGTLQGSLGDGGREVVGGESSYHSGPLTASVTAGYRHDYRQRTLDSNVSLPASPAAATSEVSVLGERTHRNIPSAGARADYALDDHQSISGSFNWLQRGGLRTYTQLNDSANSSGLLTSTRRMSRGHDPEAEYDERLGYTRKLARAGEELEVSLHRSSSHQLEHYDYTNDSFTPSAPTFYNNLNLLEDHATTEFGADYAVPFSTARSLKLGYSFERDDFRSGIRGAAVDPVTGVETVDTNATNDFNFRQDIHSGYASYQTTSEHWTVLAGLRAELTATNAALLSGNLATKDHYFEFYPSLHVTRALSEESTLSFGASRRVSRPDPSDLNPYIDYEYTPNLRAGNAYLRPQYTQSYELGYGFESGRVSYQATAYYRRNRDSVTDVTQYLGNGVSLTTRTNLPKNDSTGLELTSNGRMTSQLSYSISANLFHTQIDATALGEPGLKSTSGVNAKIKLDYQPTTADSAQLSMTRADKRLTPQGYISAVNIVSVGYKHQVKRDLTAILTASDVFNGQRNRRFESTPLFTGTYVRSVQGRIAYIGLVYSFGSAKSDKQFDYDE